MVEDSYVGVIISVHRKSILNIKGCAFCYEIFHLRSFASVMRSSVTMAISLWQKNTITLQPDMDSCSPQAARITQIENTLTLLHFF